MGLQNFPSLNIQTKNSKLESSYGHVKFVLFINEVLVTYQSLDFVEIYAFFSFMVFNFFALLLVFCIS